MCSAIAAAASSGLPRRIAPTMARCCSFECAMFGASRGMPSRSSLTPHPHVGDERDEARRPDDLGDEQVQARVGHAVLRAVRGATLLVRLPESLAVARCELALGRPAGDAHLDHRAERERVLDAGGWAERIAILARRDGMAAGRVSDTNVPPYRPRRETTHPASRERADRIADVSRLTASRPARSRSGGSRSAGCDRGRAGWTGGGAARSPRTRWPGGRA